MSGRTSTILLIAIVIGVVAGVLSGWYLGAGMMSVAWLGELFLNALKMLILPLIVAAIISSVANLGDVRRLGKVSGYTILYFAATTGIAVVIGLIMVNLIQPGAGVESLGDKMPETVEAKQDINIGDIVLKIITPNLVDSAAELELLPIILFSIAFAIAMTVTPGTQPLIRAFNSANEVMMKLVTWVMYFAPIGIFALVASRLGEAGGQGAFVNEIQKVLWHVVTVLSGLGIHLVVLLIIASLLTRRGLRFLFNMLRALFTALGTASSSATVPLTMDSARSNHLDERAIQFTIPLGSTINMNGTALYEAAAAMFIAQAYGLDLGFGDQVLIFLTATLAAIGAAGIPEAGLVTMVIVLKSVGLPLEGISLLLAVDWFLDRFRTMVNVWGDSVGAAFIDWLIRKGVVKMPNQQVGGSG
jgi:Na+/H+-dicarboxylate symporter